MAQGMLSFIFTVPGASVTPTPAAKGKLCIFLSLSLWSLHTHTILYCEGVSG